MKDKKNYAYIIFFFTVIYIFLVGQVTPFNVTIGLSLAIVSIYLTTKILREKYQRLYDFYPILFFRYVIVLFTKIIAGGLTCAKLTILDNAESIVFSYTSKLKDDNLLNLLCNSITLTPGTITVDRNEQEIKVLQLLKIGENKDISDIEVLENSLCLIEKRRALK